MEELQSSPIRPCPAKSFTKLLPFHSQPEKYQHTLPAEIHRPDQTMAQQMQSAL
ncbi:hypothetical protein GCD22_01999 [Acidithiobacillus thiooxidans ATCC 19377]|uniref:Uncharacterized protein n=1 Tax=Acidithiobacillus thiooxidans ATCC 19377 TaxID=637390 RepID=A0A5P9XR50_ACITH|nr:hypothetical protein GCD22_01999 [Acidithiobacillus thiooxidans ATCC 19377]